MSSREPPSYYEIALTNRQVFVAFVVLLVCLVAAFFSGVWIGRGGMGGEEVAAVAEPAEEAPAEEEGLGRLDFFDGGEEEPAAGEESAETAPLPEAEREERPAPGRRGETAPAPPRAPETAYVVQVFSSTDPEQARNLVRRLGAGGHRAFIASERVGGRLMHRVRIGPFPSEAAARREEEAVKREFDLETWVTSQDG